MRLWSLHPQHLDTKGLVALWREGLLAKTVLEGKTKAYINHPQLLRFRRHSNPLQAINYYLLVVQEEATRRGYAFDKSKIKSVKRPQIYPLTEGQLDYERKHLQAKLRVRDQLQHAENEKKSLEHHPLFFIIEGSVEDWEKF
jgi:hypothetical protein